MVKIDYYQFTFVQKYDINLNLSSGEYIKMN